MLIIFGPGKLPELGKTLGSGIREFRDSVGQAGSSAPAPAVPPPAVAVEVRTVPVRPAVVARAAEVGVAAAPAAEPAHPRAQG